MSAWCQVKPRKLEEVKAALVEHAPRLRLRISDAELVARGPYELIEAGAVADRYLVEIRFEAGLPAGRPKVWEIGGRIKRDKDHHINERDGSCCIAVYDEWIAKTGDDSLSSFLRVPFRNFFISQTHFCKYGQWPFEERAHGLPGMLQSYSEFWGAVQTLHPLAAISNSSRIDGRRVIGAALAAAASGSAIAAAYGSTSCQTASITRWQPGFSRTSRTSS